MSEPKRLRPYRAGRRPRVRDRDGVAVIDIGTANVWDAGDLTRIRGAASQVFARGGRRVGIELSHVGMLPSGFVHMLCGWNDKGLEVYLFSPRQNVRQMLWFRHFAEPADGVLAEEAWKMTCSPPEEAWPENERSEDASRPGGPSCEAARYAPSTSSDGGSASQPVGTN